ncbi:hypothetical protein CSB95_0223 [Pseudomonas aeruginosa]|nr:hypothetical protein CSC29_3799 [Pseudomonas aeruginosa]PRW06167.1 hypothetical protein CSB95_0223 [Pseudomonas aeruginosa]
MNQPLSSTYRHLKSVPHMRGDEPVKLGDAIREVACSPHAWG